MNVVIYVRISEDREGEAAGVGRQLKDAQKLAKDRGFTVVGVFEENDLSALHEGRRPRYEEVMRAVTGGDIQGIIVYHSSRFWRNRIERAKALEVLRKHQVSIIAIKGPTLDMSNASNRMLIGLLGEFDTAESEIKGERIARAAKERAEDGRYAGGMRPFGYNGLEVVESEAEEIRHACKQALSGVSLHSITRDFIAREVPSVTGAKWDTSTIRAILLRPRNIGLSTYKGEIVGKAQWPAILDEEKWHALRALLENPDRKKSTGNRAAFLLSGIARCGVCHEPIYSGGVKITVGGQPGTRYIYKCRKNYCISRRRDWIDSYIKDVAIDRLSRADAADLLIEEDRPDYEALRDEAQLLRVRLENAAEAYAEDEISREQLATITKRIQGRIAQIESVHVSENRLAILGDLVTAQNVAEKWAAIGLDRRRAVVKALMQVTLIKGGAGRRSFDPNDVIVEWRQ